MKKITHGSLFTGIGVFDLACKENGIENVFGCDIDTYAKLHYLEHYGNHFYDDVCTIESVPKIDILTFGFPCQDASIARPDKSNIPLNSSRTGLFYEAIRVMELCRPTVVIAENVAAFAKEGAEPVCRAFYESGYICGFAIVPAINFGAVHRRERIFFVANRHSIGRDKVIRVLKQTLVKSQKEWKIRRRFYDQIPEDLLSEAISINHGVDYGTSDWLQQGLRAKAIGNAIFYPVAQTFIREVKEIYFT